jgi:hypothetical protein
VTHPATTACCSCLGTMDAHGGRRDGALLGSGRGKQRAMAVGVQAVPTWHAQTAKQGARAEKRGGLGQSGKWGAQFPRSSIVRRRNGLQPRLSGRGRPAKRPSASSVDCLLGPVTAQG